MTRLISRTALGIAGLAATLTAGTALAENFRYSQWLPVGHFTQREILHPVFKEIADATDKRVNMQPTAKALGPPGRHYQLTIDGITDIGFQAHGYSPGAFPMSEMAELPFITKSAEANSVAYWRVFKKVFEPAGMHKDVYTLNVHVHPPGHLYNTKRPVAKIADFEGLKFRSTTTIVSESLRLFGAVPVAGPVTALRDGLAKGVYDGTSFTDEAVYNFKISKFIKHVTHFPGGLYNTSFLIVMNKNSWDKISEADRKVVMDHFGEAYSKRIGKRWDEYEAAAPAKLKADGASYHTLQGEALEDVKAKIGFFEKEWIEKVGKIGVDGKAALEMFRSEIAAYGS